MAITQPDILRESLMGEYHVISNMKTGKINHGLFGIVSGGTENLGVEDADITFTDGDSSCALYCLNDKA